MHRTPSDSGVVLIVDDVIRNLQILGGLLAPHRFEVMFADNGETALRRAGTRPPDLILLDLLMPGLDGMEVCHRLKRDPGTADIPVVFLTAARESAMAADAIHCGAVDYITRPFDVTEFLARVRAHVGLKRARDELRRTIGEKNELMSAVAHELKNPVATVRQTALRLREQGVRQPDARAELVDEILTTCDGVLDFIHDRLEKSSRAVELESVACVSFDVCEVVTAALTQHNHAAAAKDISLEIDAPKSPVLAMADPGALVRVLNNLLSNAVKFSPRSRRVRVVVRPEDAKQRVRIEVRDQGPGLTKEDRRHLFTPYRRLSAQPTGGESSTGLGLSIAHELMKKMRGSIGCRSRATGGACFWVRLPASRE